MNELKKFISPFDQHVIKEYADFFMFNHTK